MDYQQRAGPDGHRVHWTPWSAFQVFPFVFTLGLGILLSTLAVLLAPGLTNEASSIVAVLPGWTAFLWTTCYAIGGALMVAGVSRLSPRLEAAGLYLLAGVQVVNVTALVSNRDDWQDIFLSVSLFAALAVAAAARATILLVVFPERRERTRRQYRGE